MKDKIQKPGQILVVLLIVLSILSIFVVIVATNARRDSIERVQNEQYEQALTIAENQLLQIVSGDLDITNSPDCALVGTEIQCDFVDQTEDSALGRTQVKIVAETTNRIEDYALEKDKQIKISLHDPNAANTNFYANYLDLSWQGAVAWIISLDYKNNTTGEYLVIKDVYDNAGIYSQPITQHCFSFSNPTANSVRVNIFSVFPTCVPASGYQLLSIRFRAITDLPTVAGLSIIPANTVGPAPSSMLLPAQSRVVTAETYSIEAGLAESPHAIVVMTQPLYPPPFEILDYVLRSQTDINK